MHLLDRAAHGNRLRHRHPAEKALFSVALLGVCLLLPPWPACALVAATTAGATLFIARIKPGMYLRALLAPLGFMLIAGVSLAIGIQHTPDSGYHLVVSREGLSTAVQVLSRSLAAFSCLLFLALTTPLPALLGLMRRCRIPGAIVDTSLLIYNMLFVFSGTWQRMAMAQQARLGYGTMRQAYRSTASLVAGLLGQALHRARCMENGLASRGFQGQLRVAADETPLSVQALFLVAALVGLITALSLLVGA